MISTNKKREETSSKTYTVERLLKQRKRKGRIEYLVKWKHYDKSHNSWEPEGNILDKSLIDSYKKQIKSTSRRTLSPKKSIRNQNDDLSSVKNDSIHDGDEQLEKEDDNNKQEKIINSTSIDYWYPPVCEQKAKIAITDITSDNVTITFRELI
ncbi:unnamed protein product [Rotaria sp. Silwood2]|nr:unnamed protein product [Rotaria sp. Silwood2]CAF2574875.1 unnamed protein product [Rotaria sp. Silwood2]CAF2822777.1 unnamed protein product [Rotaria sp. Silwood2]CAF4012317.1 unnamed protein product [Rotaria sp. Silwood2]CAF4078148.1 unnamed protein product [Rotaria sp. Silwood2]